VLFVRILMNTPELVILHEQFWRHAWRLAKELNMVHMYEHVYNMNMCNNNIYNYIYIGGSVIVVIYDIL